MECARCGLIFAKYRPPPAAAPDTLGLDATGEPAAPLPPTALSPAPVAPSSPIPLAGEGGPLRALERPGRRALALGLGLAVLTYVLPFTRFLLGYLVTLVHELGHTAVGWIFGYPSIPAFDFFYGGGMSLHGGRSAFLMLIVYALMAAAFYWLRSFPKLQGVVGGFAVLYSVVAFTGLHDLVLTAMGHGAELLFAAIFFYRAMTGFACRLEVERPLYAMLGWFIEIHAVVFAGGLVVSDDARRAYEAAKGGGRWMDLSVLAEDHLGTSLETAAGAFLVLSPLPLLAAYLLVRHGDRWWERLREALT